MTSRPVEAAHPPGVDDADRVLAELHVAARRVDRVADAVGAYAGPAPLGPWARTHRSCLAALEALRQAAGSVPDIPAAAMRPRGWIVVGPLRIRPAGRVAILGDRPLALTGKEFDLLARLAAEPFAVVDKATLYCDVWGIETRYPSARSVDSHASKLRRRLTQAGAAPGEWVVNSWGRGYSLRPPVTAALRGAGT